MNTNSRQRRPNVIIILIDTLRADHLSCYGYEHRTTPCIDQIAAEGVLYEKAISPAAWTPPAHASLFTGAYPSRHGVDRSHLVLDPTLLPLPEVLRNHGYRTYGVSSNYWLSRETRFDRGFDHFVHSWQLVQAGGANAPLQRQHRKHALGLDTLPHDPQKRGIGHIFSHTLNSLYERATQTLRRTLHAYDDGAWRVNYQVRRWISEWRRHEQPFFAFLHYMEPHIRYAAPGRYHTMHLPTNLQRQRVNKVNQDPWRYLTGQIEMDEEDFFILKGLYDGEISYVDARVGQLYTLLREHGLLQDTLLILTSDHGENLGEHGLMDHAYCLYDTLLHVPLIVCGPTEFLPGQRITQQVQTLDLFPTILNITGIDDKEVWSQVQGRDLFPATLRREPERQALAEYLEPQPPLSVLQKRYPGFDGARYNRTLRAIRTEQYKYVWASDGQDECYDLSVDPHEEQNLIARQATKARQLRAILEEKLGTFTPTVLTQESLDLDQVTLKRLEQLGYLSS